MCGSVDDVRTPHAEAILPFNNEECQRIGQAAQAWMKSVNPNQLSNLAPPANDNAPRVLQSAHKGRQVS